MANAITKVMYVHAYAPYRPDSGGPKWRDSDISLLYIYVDSSVPYAVKRFIYRAKDLWNSLGVVRFVLTNDLNLAKIRVMYDSSLCGGWAIVYTSNPEKYIIYAEIALGDPSCVFDANWYTAVTVHELGHVLGLGHSKGAPSIMGDAWDTYKIPAPMYDDIVALWMLYGRGRLFTISFTSWRGDYQEWSSNINELAGYPYLLRISPGINNFVFKGKNLNFLPLWSYMIAGYVNPQIVYRGAIGLWTSIDATDQTARVSIIEFSTDGINYYIALTYTSSSFGQTVKKLFSITKNVFSDAGFFVQLILYLDVNGNARPLVVVYRGTDIIAYLGLDNAQVLYINPFIKSSVNVGFAVWTDNASNPPSTYSFGPLWGNSG